MSHSQGLSFTPLYQQVKDAVLERIIAGEWPAGTFLPSEPVLAQEYGVSHGTMRRALDALTRENRLTRYQGKGTAVAILDEDKALFQFFRLARDNGERVFPSSQIIDSSTGTQKATEEEAKALNIATGVQVFRLHRIRLLDNLPVVNEVITLPFHLFPGIEKCNMAKIPNTIYAYYQQQFAITVSHATEALTATLADGGDMRLLGVGNATPILLIKRIAFNIEGAPVEYRVSRTVTDNINYQANL